MRPVPASGGNVQSPVGEATLVLVFLAALSSCARSGVPIESTSTAPVAATSAVRDGASSSVNAVIPPPPNVVATFHLSPFYKKYVDVDGMPIVASERVSDYALFEARFLVQHMIGDRPDILRAIAANNVRLAVMATSEMTTDIPEHADLEPKGLLEPTRPRARRDDCATRSERRGRESARFAGRSVRRRKHSDPRICARDPRARSRLHRPELRRATLSGLRACATEKTLGRYVCSRKPN